MKRTLLALIVSAALSVAVFAAAGQAGKAPALETVGGFAMKVAVAFGADVTDQTTAVASLKALGVSVGEDASAPLTEKRAAQILADLGLQVVPPANPDKAVTVGMANVMATRVGLTASRKSGLPEANLPTECLSSSNRGQCVECCKAATQCGTSTGTFECNACARFCKANVPPPPSPGGP